MSKKNVIHLIQEIYLASCKCPAHSSLMENVSFKRLYNNSQRESSSTEYAFEMACSSIRYGKGVTQEVGFDIQSFNAKKCLVVTDQNLSKMKPALEVLDSLTKHKVNFSVFDEVEVEPTDKSFLQAISYAKEGKFDTFVAVGGGSVIDTCKVANLYSSDLNADFLDYVNAPIGKGMPVTVQLFPLIAVPTTAGTGSETTGVAIFDYTPMNAKTGIASRALRPTLGIIDPLHTLSMPERVTAYSGFDVLCHALESYTAIPYSERSPRPARPVDRPAYQGSNPISDLWSCHALEIIRKYFKRSVYNRDDFEARSNMHLASCFAGIGFGNAGVHLCHGMSYPISGMVKDYKPLDYRVNKPLIPHGLSVVMTSPAVFQYTAPMCPERHLKAAELLGCDVSKAKKADAGKILADVLRSYMLDMKIENGLSSLGFNSDDIPRLVQGTLPQHRVTKLAPRSTSENDLAQIFENSMTVY